VLTNLIEHELVDIIPLINQRMGNEHHQFYQPEFADQAIGVILGKYIMIVLLHCPFEKNSLLSINAIRQLALNVLVMARRFSEVDGTRKRTRSV
jgi:hypothetical protein